MQTRRFPYIVSLILFAVLALAACTKPDRSEEANKLRYELRDLMFKNPEQVLVRIDSAE